MGDQFLQGVFGLLTAIHNEAEKSSSRMPYIYEFYNISPYWKFTPSMTVQSTLARIYNSVVEGINSNSHLPRMLILFPGRDVLRKAAFYNLGASLVIGDNIEWLVDNCTSVVETRKTHLRNKRPGAVCQSEPKFIWVKMAYRPHREHLQQLCKKFNEILEETAAGHKNCYVIDPD